MQNTDINKNTKNAELINELNNFDANNKYILQSVWVFQNYSEDIIDIFTQARKVRQSVFCSILKFLKGKFWKTMQLHNRLLRLIFSCIQYFSSKKIAFHYSINNFPHLAILTVNASRLRYYLTAGQLRWPLAKKNTQRPFRVNYIFIIFDRRVLHVRNYRSERIPRRFRTSITEFPCTRTEPIERFVHRNC